MSRPIFYLFTTFSAIFAVVAAASAQSVESAGQRALGMGGAFVAVADDSSATWWNPAGLAIGPFLDLAIGRVSGSTGDSFPGSRTGLWSVSLATPPLGLSYYRFRITDIAPSAATGTDAAGREDRTAEVGIRTLSITQIGATVLHTITTGVSAGATVKYVHGRFQSQIDVSAASADPSELLDLGEDLDGGEAGNAADLDFGVLANFGAFRAGATVRNLREPQFGSVHLPRQVRAGGAFDGAAAGAVPLTLSIDADLHGYEVLAGERRVVAVGAEHWIRPGRVAVRGGARFNTIGRQDRVVTAGATATIRAGLFVEGHAAFGTDHSESGWGIAARVSF